jgi:hypothetical protein
MRIARLAVCTILPLSVTANGVFDTPLDRAFNRLYNLDFRTAHKILDDYTIREPRLPLTPAVRAAAILFEELDRMQTLQGEFFSDDKRIAAKRSSKPDPALRDRFYKSVEHAQQLAREVLGRNSTDPDALFTLSLTTGLVGDYLALIEKRHVASLSSIKQSNEHAMKLIRAHPNYVDGYLTTGFSDYLIGSLPFFVRWFVKIEGVEGNKTTGVRTLERVADSGRYMRPFAKLLLSIFHLREKNYTKCQEVLREYSREFPENQVVKKEIEKVGEMMARQRR